MRRTGRTAAHHVVRVRSRTACDSAVDRMERIVIRPVPDTGCRFVTTDLDSARAAIGHALIASNEHAIAIDRLGEITLMPHQRDAITRLRSALERFGGALLADDVGLGKTFVALGVAREYPRTHVLAPAALVPMWHSAITRAAATQVTVHSLHGFSKPQKTGASQALGDLSAHRELLIIDEAHYLRNHATARYRAVSLFASGRDVLLLSATPVHNATSDLRNMLGLFAGSRSDILEPGVLAQLIVRRED